MPSAGQRPRVIDNERLDIPDFDALSALIYQWSQDAAGMELGVGEGVLSPPTVTYEEVGVGPTRQIRLGECTLYAAQNNGSATNQATGYPVNYSPTAAVQVQTTIDLSAYPNAGGAIWWTVDLVNTELDNRRVWEAGYPDGRAVAMLTRQEQRIRFAVTPSFSTLPTPGTWFRMGAFFLPTSGAPTVLWAHAYDWGREDDLAAFIATGDDTAVRWRIGQWLFQEGYNPASNVGRSFGAGRYSAQLAAAVLTLLDSDWVYDPQTLEITAAGTVGFETAPTMGARQVSTALTTQTAQVAALQTRYRLAYWARVNDDGTVANEGGDGIEAAAFTVTVTHGGTGVYSFAFSAALAAATNKITVMAKINSPSLQTGDTYCLIASSTSVTVSTFNIISAPEDRPFVIEINALNDTY